MKADILSARSSMDRVLPSEGRGCGFDPRRARQMYAFYPTNKIFIANTLEVMLSVKNQSEEF